ncbi:MAG: E3 binding domain-containing protein, partial [Desulfuromusa sp.]|nr:E3 binding domain-containing protein [Desulfuromusa sp.]
MSLEIIVPEVSDGVTAGMVVSVEVAVGDQVEEDQTLLELETDKAVVAIPSPAAGVITTIKVAEGDSAAVGSVIMLLEPAVDLSENPSAASAEETEVKPLAETQRKDSATVLPEAAPLPPAIADPVAESVDLTSVRRDNQVAPAAPSVRRMARDLGVDIYQVQGSGSGGRISEEDVRLFVR